MAELYYFSGTGNTAILANHLASSLAEKTGDEHVPVPIEEVTGRRAGQSPPSPSGLVILLYPVHAFDAPEIVYDFVTMLPPGADSRFVLVKVGSDTICLNAGASHFLKRRIERKGYAVVHEELFAMPCSFIASYPEDLNVQLLNASLKRIDTLAERIVTGDFKPDKAPLAARILTLFCRIERIGAKWFGRSLTATSACTLCMRCVDRCPRGNIRVADSKIGFGSRCVLCMRCIYGCPEDAIKSRGMQFAVINEGYDIRAIVAKSSGNAVYINGDTKGYFKHLKSYVL